MKYITSLFTVVLWLLTSHAGQSGEAPLQVLSGARGSDGLFRLQIVATKSLSYEVQASTNLLQWEPLQTNTGTGNLVEYVDANTKVFLLRYYRLMEHWGGLTLSSAIVRPCEKLVITGGPFDPSARTLVKFLDATGSEVQVRAFTVSTGSVVVAVPFLVNTNAPQVRGGMANVSLAQETVSGTNVFKSAQTLQILDLAVTGLPPGAVTLAYLNQVSNQLATASSRWLTIEIASEGKVDSSALRLNLLTMQTNVLTAQKMIQSIISGQMTNIPLGRIQDRDVALNLDAVMLLDRMLAASLNYRPPTTLQALRALSTLDSTDILAGIGDEFNPGRTFQSTFEMFDQFNSIGGMSVGILATMAVALGIAAAPAAAALAGTAGAVLFFSTCIAPAVMGSSVMALAEPFIEVQTGHQVTMDDYKPALDHIQKGSQAYIYDEVQGHLLEGVFQSHGASEALTAQASLFLSTSKAVIENLDLSKPQSIGSLAVANAEVIFANLRPATDPVTYSAHLIKTFNSITPDGGWQDDMDATLTIRISGEGTVASPFSGAFLYDGTIDETLLYCHSTTAPCDPGGLYLLELTDGLVKGANGVVTAEGMGIFTAAEGSAPFPFQFSSGVISGNTLTGTFTLGDIQEWVVTLTKQ